MSKGTPKSVRRGPGPPADPVHRLDHRERSAPPRAAALAAASPAQPAPTITTSTSVIGNPPLKCAQDASPSPANSRQRTCAFCKYSLGVCGGRSAPDAEEERASAPTRQRTCASGAPFENRRNRRAVSWPSRPCGPSISQADHGQPRGEQQPGPGRQDSGATLHLGRQIGLARGDADPAAARRRCGPRPPCGCRACPSSSRVTPPRVACGHRGQQLRTEAMVSTNSRGAAGPTAITRVRSPCSSR